MRNYTEALFIADAASFIIGHDLYEVHWVPKPFSGRRFHVVSCVHERVGGTNWQDDWYNVQLAYPPDAQVTMKTLEYRRSNGEVGFDCLAEDHYDSLFSWFMREAWTWDEMERKFINFETFETKRRSEDRPDRFILRGYTGPPQSEQFLIFHSPSAILKSYMEEANRYGQQYKGRNAEAPLLLHLYDISAEERLLAIDELVEECKFMTTWKAERPTVFSANIAAFVEDLRQECMKQSLDFKTVKHESDLPAW